MWALQLGVAETLPSKFLDMTVAVRETSQNILVWHQYGWTGNQQ